MYNRTCYFFPLLFFLLLFSVTFYPLLFSCYFLSYNRGLNASTASRGLNGRRPERPYTPTIPTDEPTMVAMLVSNWILSSLSAIWRNVDTRDVQISSQSSAACCWQLWNEWNWRYKNVFLFARHVTEFTLIPGLLIMTSGPATLYLCIVNNFRT